MWRPVLTDFIVHAAYVDDYLLGAAIWSPTRTGAGPRRQGGICGISHHGAYEFLRGHVEGDPSVSYTRTVCVRPGTLDTKGTLLGELYALSTPSTLGPLPQVPVFSSTFLTPYTFSTLRVSTSGVTLNWSVCRDSCFVIHDFPHTEPLGECSNPRSPRGDT